jgi:hypothetical protein
MLRDTEARRNDGVGQFLKTLDALSKPKPKDAN